jgi:hypothetical protein
MAQLLLMLMALNIGTKKASAITYTKGQTLHIGVIVEVKIKDEQYENS